MTTHHPKFSILYSALQLDGLTIAKLLPTALMLVENELSERQT